MDELKQMKQVLNPTEVFLVVDAMTGQEAACKIPYSLQICLSVSILDPSFNTLMPHSNNIFQGFCKLRIFPWSTLSACAHLNCVPTFHFLSPCLLIRKFQPSFMATLFFKFQAAFQHFVLFYE